MNTDLKVSVEGLEMQTVKLLVTYHGDEPAETVTHKLYARDSDSAIQYIFEYLGLFVALRKGENVLLGVKVTYAAPSKFDEK